MEVKMEVIEGSCSLYFFIFYGVRSLRQKWTIAASTHLSFFNSPFNSLFYFLFNSRNIHEYEL